MRLSSPKLTVHSIIQASWLCSVTWLCTKTVATSGSRPTANSIAASSIVAVPSVSGPSVMVSACRSTMPWKASFSCCPDTQLRSAPK